jgi:hypothetical protein
MGIKKVMNIIIFRNVLYGKEVAFFIGGAAMK